MNRLGILAAHVAERGIVASELLAGCRFAVVGAGVRPNEEPEAPWGNGRAIAVAIAAAGGSVVCSDISEASAEETANLIRDIGGNASVATFDVCNADECERFMNSFAENPLDGLVLNVGSGRGRKLAGTSEKDWDDTFAINLRSHFILSRAAIGALNTGASIVYIGSVAGLRPGSMIPAYDASKAALIGLCRHVALEGSRRGIRANLVAPGLIDTPMGRATARDRPSRNSAYIPLGRQGTAAEIAGPVVFLLSRLATYVTGQTLVVDGGLTLA